MVNAIFVSQLRIIFKFTKSCVVGNKVENIGWIMAWLKSNNF